MNILAYMHTLGVYCILGIPNTTHVNQETDRNYDLFKPIFCTNIETLS